MWNGFPRPSKFASKNQVRRLIFERLFGRISSDCRQYCLCHLHFIREQIILQNAPRSGCTDTKKLTAITSRHFWILGNVLFDRFNQFIGTSWSLMNGMPAIFYCSVLYKIRNQTPDSIVRRCLLTTMFSTICTLFLHNWVIIFNVHCHYFDAFFRR